MIWGKRIKCFSCLLEFDSVSAVLVFSFSFFLKHSGLLVKNRSLVVGESSSFLERMGRWIEYLC